MISATLRANAACATTDPDMWFPDAGQTATALKAICNQCPVKDECLDFALSVESSGHQSRHGIWGGTSPKERDAIAQRRRTAA